MTTALTFFACLDDGIERDIVIRQELFGVIKQYGVEFDVMRFSLSNKVKDAITVQVMSLGAALTGIICPDRYRSAVTSVILTITTS